MHKDGFTLIEVLIVLSILGALLLLITPLNNLFLEKQREKQFLREFSSDMLLMQTQSRTTLRKVRFHYSEENQRYKINKGTTNLVERDIPPGWRFQMRTYDIKFSYSGAISKPGHIMLKTNNNTYKIVFSLGKGRFRIEKI